jgi:hypothetical protein
MANRMMVWGAIGKPNQREWVAGPRNTYEKNDGIFPSGYALFSTVAPNHLAEIEQTRLNTAKAAEAPQRPERRATFDATRLWKGWILPAGDADTWFAAGSTAYYRTLQSDDIEKAMDAVRIQYRGLKLAADNPVTRVRSEEAKGVLFLDQLRRKMGDDKFLALMNDFFAANTTKTVTAQSFLAKAGVGFDFLEPAAGPLYAIADMSRRLANAVIVYGTQREAGANRYAAEQLQAGYLSQLEHQIPIYKDFEVTEEFLTKHDVIFIGRPEANTALAAWAKPLELDYEGAVFKIDGKTHAGERDALALAAPNPRDRANMVLVLAGNDALRTVKLASTPRFDQTAWALNTAAPAATGRRRP